MPVDQQQMMAGRSPATKENQISPRQLLLGLSHKQQNNSLDSLEAMTPTLADFLISNKRAAFKITKISCERRLQCQAQLTS